MGLISSGEPFKRNSRGQKLKRSETISPAGPEEASYHEFCGFSEIDSANNHENLAKNPRFR